MTLVPIAIRRLAFLLLLATAVACSPGEEGDYLHISGGGFIFNYRIAEAYYGFVAEPLRELPEGEIVAEFEDPAGGKPIIVRQRTSAAPRRYTLQTPPVTGISKDRDYHVVVRLTDASGAVLETHERSFRSNLDDAVLPEQQLTIGPGYHRNPESRQ